jgi:hypothetical protein
MCDVLDAVATEESAFASALSAFCGGASEQTARSEGPSLGCFVQMVEDLREDQVKVAVQLRAALVTAVEQELDGDNMKRIRDGQSAVAKADSDGESGRGRRFMVPLVGGHERQSQKSATAAKQDLTEAVRMCEQRTDEVLRRSFVQVASALTHYFKQGAAVMHGLETCVDSMQPVQQGAAAQQVRPALRASCAWYEMRSRCGVIRVAWCGRAHVTSPVTSLRCTAGRSAHAALVLQAARCGAREGAHSAAAQQ